MSTAYVHTYIYVKNMTIIIKHGNDGDNDEFICKSGDECCQQSSGGDDDDVGHCDKQESLYEDI